MMHCFKCNEEVDSDDDFCGNCSIQLQCKVCCKRYKKVLKYCTSCKTPAQQDEHDSHSGQQTHTNDGIKSTENVNNVPVTGTESNERKYHEQDEASDNIRHKTNSDGCTNSTENDKKMPEMEGKEMDGKDHVQDKDDNHSGHLTHTDYDITSTESVSNIPITETKTNHTKHREQGAGDVHQTNTDDSGRLTRKDSKKLKLENKKTEKKDLEKTGYKGSQECEEERREREFRSHSNDWRDNQKCDRITFEILLHPDFKMDLATDTIELLVFGFWKRTRLSTKIDNIQNHEFEGVVFNTIRGNVLIPTFWIEQGEGLQYKYMVIQSHRHTTEYWNRDCRRLQKFGGAKRKSEDHVVFDGAVCRKKDFYMIHKSMQSIQEQAAMCLFEVYLTSILPKVGDKYNAKSVCSNIISIVRSLETNYFIPSKLEVKKLLETFLVKQINRVVAGDGMNDRFISHFVQTVLVIVNTFQCNLPVKERRILANLALPKDGQEKSFTMSTIDAEDVRAAILYFCDLFDDGSDTGDAHWLQFIPLIHFTSGINPNTNIVFHPEIRDFWGNGLIKERILKLMRKKKQVIAIGDIWEKLRDYFMFDGLLERTLTTCLLPEQLVKMVSEDRIRQEIAVMAINRFINIYSNEKIVKTFASSVKALNLALKTQHMRVESICQNHDEVDYSLVLKDTTSMLTASNYLVHNAWRNFGGFADFQSGILLLHVQSISNQEYIIGVSGKGFNVTLSSKIRECQRILEDIINRHHDRLKDIVTVLCILLDVRTSDEDSVITGWLSYGLKLLQNAIRKKNTKDVLKVFCEFESDMLLPCIEECVENELRMCLPDMYTQDIIVQNKVKDIFWHRGELFGRLYSFVLLERRRHTNDDLSVILNWPTIVPAIKWRGKQQNQLNNLTEDARTYIEELWNYLLNLNKSLETGDITVGDLNKISENRNMFLLVLGETGLSKRNLQTLDRCLTVVDKFQTRERYLIQLLEKCDDSLVDTVVLENEIARASVQTLSIQEIRNSISETVFGSKNFDKVLVKFSRGMQSCIVRLLWDNQWEKVREEFLITRMNVHDKLPIIDMLSKVWEPVYREWIEFGKQVQEGSITTSEIAKHMDWGEQPASTGPGFTNELRQEFRFIGQEIGNDLGFVELRVSQIVKAYAIKQKTKLACTILEVIRKYSLTGDYTYLEDIIRAEQHDLAISRINEGVSNIARQLDGISFATITGLKIFKKCYRLVRWIRETMPGGDPDVKAFVDVALTIIEAALDIGKIQCFHSATLGYAPLIFMAKDVACDDLIDRIRTLEDAIAVNPKLPDNLEATKLCLEWLQTVNKSHSGNETSIDTAELLTTEGICTVGSFDSDIEPMLMELPDVVAIKAHDKPYTLEDLNDVQSKLVLRGGESDFVRKKNDSEDDNAKIERFTTVFECLRRMGAAYIKLLRTGCILFQLIRFEFKCTGFPVCKIYFDTGSSTSSLDVATDNDDDIGNSPNDVQHYITELSKFLEDCYKEWTTEIKYARDHFYFLNFFTIHQIIHLQTALGRLKTKETDSLSNKVYHILSLVKPNLQISDVKNSLEDLNSSAGEQIHHKSLEYLIVTERHMMEKRDLFDKVKGCVLRIWNKFKDQNNLMIDNYLNFRQLSDFLTAFNSRTDQICMVPRDLPAPLIPGTGNLLLCEEGEVLATTLMLYIQGEKRSLPQPDEILMCTMQTTSDQFEAFVKRAMQSNRKSQKKIYTLINADLLNYNVSREAEVCLNRHIYDADSDYQLVMVCSKANESKSLLIGAWDCYRRPLFPIDIEGMSTIVQSLLRSEGQVSLDKSFKRPIKARSLVSEGYMNNKISNVRIVTSSKAGQGKSLYVQQQKEIIDPNNVSRHISFALMDRVVNVDHIMKILQEKIVAPQDNSPRIIHIDISPEVQEGVDYLLFNLLVIGFLSSSTGAVWQKRDIDVYIVECMESSILGRENKACKVHEILRILPRIVCLSPLQCKDKPKFGRGYLQNATRLGFNRSEYQSTVFQRPYKYLRDMESGRRVQTQTSAANCLEILLGNCCINDPSWAEIKQFVLFLDRQITDFECSVFCSGMLSDALPGFSHFVLRFLKQMAQDFATRSLYTEDSHGSTPSSEDDIKQYQMRRTWESSPHPYLFFNPDRNSMTFLGFNINPKTMDLIDDRNKTVLEQRIMTKHLWDSLNRNGVPLQEDVSTLARKDLIQKMFTVMGVETKITFDPDDTYELTSDNVKKMMAIFMRFRCCIPVIIMGETGCGKTTLVKFLCSLQCPPGKDIRNMILMKVHGGTTKEDIRRHVDLANKIALENKEQHGDNLYTVLFFDEANTTEAIEFIKGIICDNVMDGEKLYLCPNLKFIAACNPYRK